MFPSNCHVRNAVFRLAQLTRRVYRWVAACPTLFLAAIAVTSLPGLLIVFTLLRSRDGAVGEQVF